MALTSDCLRIMGDEFWMDRRRMKDFPHVTKENAHLANRQGTIAERQRTLISHKICRKNSPTMPPRYRLLEHPIRCSYDRTRNFLRRSKIYKRAKDLGSRQAKTAV